MPHLECITGSSREVTPIESLTAEVAKTNLLLQQQEERHLEAIGKLANAYQVLVLQVAWLRRAIRWYWIGHVVSWSLLAWMLVSR